MDNLAANQFLAMKRNISILSLLGAFAILFVGAMILSSCEGPAGPQGPPGTNGTNGTNGVDGTDGTDGVAGNAVCLTCHNLVVKAAITDEYLTSLHGSGAHTARGSSVGCAKCHAHEGFVETTWTGRDTTAAAIPIPTVITCQTCHDFHESLDFANEPNHAIRTSDEVDLIAGGGPVGFAANAESNLCMNCHQSRGPAPTDVKADSSLEVPEHVGPHHAPQANFINGLVGYEFGVVLGVSGPHEAQASCITCHMAETAADTTGGHTWLPGIEACVGCHPGATDFDINGKVTEIEGLIEDLAAALTTAGMMVDGEIVEDTMYEADSVGAVWNYILVEEDRSMGIHNPAYAEALLTNSIAAIDGSK